MKNVIMTGATSLVGTALADECIKHGVGVTAIVRKNSGKLGRLPESPLVRIIECDLEAMADTPLDINGDVFYHFGWSHTDKAGRTDPALQERNIRYSLDALQLAVKSGCTKFIGAGSQAEYGIHLPGRTAPDSPLLPQDAYGIAKAAAGRLCSIQAQKFGMDIAWIRIFSLYGKFELENTLIQTTIKKMLRNETCSFSPCTHRWDYLYSADAGRAFFLIGEKLHGNKIYCLGSGQERPLREYVEEMKNVIGSDSELRFGDFPYPAVKPTGFCADISSLTADTGWKPQTSFRDGILEEAERLQKTGEHK